MLVISSRLNAAYYAVITKIRFGVTGCRKTYRQSFSTSHWLKVDLVVLDRARSMVPLHSQSGGSGIKNLQVLRWSVGSW